MLYWFVKIMVSFNLPTQWHINKGNRDFLRNDNEVNVESSEKVQNIHCCWAMVLKSLKRFVYSTLHLNLFQKYISFYLLPYIKYCYSIPITRITSDKSWQRCQLKLFEILSSSQKKKASPKIPLTVFLFSWK